MRDYFTVLFVILAMVACGVVFSADEDAPFVVQVDHIVVAYASSCPSDDSSVRCAALADLDKKARWLTYEVRAHRLSEEEAKRQLVEARMNRDPEEQREAERRERQRLADEDKRLADHADREKAEQQRKVEACKAYMWTKPNPDVGMHGALGAQVANVGLCDIDSEAPFKLPQPTGPVPVVVVGHE